jgi:hypothetical protein
MKTLKQKMQVISAERRKRIVARVAALIVEEVNLQELRKARKRNR